MSMFSITATREYLSLRTLEMHYSTRGNAYVSIAYLGLAGPAETPPRAFHLRVIHRTID
jgi:hypothetical protein